jgi:hypothetical protein
MQPKTYLLTLRAVRTRSSESVVLLKVLPLGIWREYQLSPVRDVEVVGTPHTPVSLRALLALILE